MASSLEGIYPPEIWARESLMILGKNTVMAGLVHRNFESEVASYGDTVNTRRPTKLTVQDVANTVLGGGDATATPTQGGLEISTTAATNVQITLDQHKAVAFAITQRDQDTSIKNLIEEFMEPALIPMAEKIDADLLNGTNGLGLAVAASTVTTATQGAIVLGDFANVQKQLMINEVPMTSPAGIPNITMVMSPEHYAHALTVPEIVTANQGGTNPPPVRTGFVGKVFGMGLYASQNVPATDGLPATEPAGELKNSVVFHRNALTLITRPLEQVNSQFGVRSATVTKDGVGLRVMMSYSHVDLKWIVSVDILYGFKLLDDNLRLIMRDKDLVTT